MKNKRFGFAIKIPICIFLMLIVFICPVYAEDKDDGLGELQEQYEQLLNESGAYDLAEAVPDDARSILSDNNIKIGNAASLLDMSFTGFMSNIWSIITDSFGKPMLILFSSIAVILLCALLNSLKSGFEKTSYERVFSVVSVMCISAAIIIPIANLIERSSIVIKQVAGFMLAFVPVYVGIISGTGKPISAVTYQLSLVSIVQIISRIATVVLVPLLAIYLAFCLIGSTSSQINVQGIAKGVKTTVTVVLSFLLTIFVGLLAIQGVVSTSADTLALKTTKFALSTFLPVVGSAISEALNSMQGCMGLMKSTVGGFSIFVLAAAFLPNMITIILMQLSLSISASISDMLETDKISALMRAAGSVMSILLGIMLTFFALLTISIGIMLTLGN